MSERDQLFLGHILAAITDIEFSVNLDAVWSMVEQDLPALRAEVGRLAEG